MGTRWSTSCPISDPVPCYSAWRKSRWLNAWASASTWETQLKFPALGCIHFSHLRSETVSGRLLSLKEKSTSKAKEENMKSSQYAQQPSLLSTSHSHSGTFLTMMHLFSHQYHPKSIVDMRAHLGIVHSAIAESAWNIHFHYPESPLCFSADLSPSPTSSNHSFHCLQNFVLSKMAYGCGHKNL